VAYFAVLKDAFTKSVVRHVMRRIVVLSPRHDKLGNLDIYKAADSTEIAFEDMIELYSDWVKE
jgi:hypothetical protein